MLLVVSKSGTVFLGCAVNCEVKIFGLPADIELARSDIALVAAKVIALF